MGVLGTWFYKDKRYILAEEKAEGSPSEIIIDLEEFVKRISELDEEIIESLQNGKIIFDPTGLLSATSEAIRLGLIVGSKEDIIKKLVLLRLKLRDIERLKIEILVNLYNAATDALQAIVLRETGRIVVPKHLSEYVKEKMDKKYYKDAENYKKIYDAIKKLEHERKVPDFEEMDELIKITKEIVEDAK